MHYQVLDAVNYGIPQKRRRIFVVGFKEGGQEFKFPVEKQLHFSLQDFLLENAPDGHVVANNGKITIEKANGNVPEKYFLSDRILPGIMSEGTGGFSMTPEIDLKIARPLMSTMHKMHRAGEDNYVTTNGKIRRLAPRECLRLMGFTDDFKIAVSDTQMYKQAGNSVVVDVLMELITETFLHTHTHLITLHLEKKHYLAFHNLPYMFLQHSFSLILDHINFLYNYFDQHCSYYEFHLQFGYTWSLAFFHHCHMQTLYLFQCPVSLMHVQPHQSH